jgi:hypothetical protein
MQPTVPAPVPWREPPVVFWSLALGMLALAALAPTRPWGWTGQAYLGQACLCAAVGLTTSRGRPGRARWRWVVAGAALFVAVVQVLGLLLAAAERGVLL